MQPADLPTEPSALVDALLGWAVREKVSDLHFAPFPGTFVARGRVDGLFRDLTTLDAALYQKATSRIKVAAEMDIAEKRRPQDGRFTHAYEGRAIDVRVSSVPTLHGESLVLRILDRASGVRSLDQIGLLAAETKALRSFLSEASGLLVVTGPTGAGKTTTLYASLLELAVPERNVLTIEDPVEYELGRVLQTSVSARLGNTFAGLLRSLLRHDPDVIMVGEVRDAETAEVAVRAALTGHLVLTSLHTERAAGAVSVLLNFGVKPYALAPGLRGVVAQQLVRTICPDCKARYEYGSALLDDPDVAGLLHEGETPSFSMGLGCDACFRSGYRGRSGIFEVLGVSEEVRAGILRAASAGEIERAAVGAGMSTLRRNGFRAVLDGRTTIEEVVRMVHVE